jgi:hypothetical protein
VMCAADVAPPLKVGRRNALRHIVKMHRVKSDAQLEDEQILVAAPGTLCPKSHCEWCP